MGLGRRRPRWSPPWPHRPGTQHVVITGRRADPGLVEAADLVTEMTKVKHPMDAGQKGQRASSGERCRGVVVAAPAPVHGKTTVATGLMAALRARGPAVSRAQGRPRLHRPRLPRRSPPAAPAATSTRGWSART